ncbi:hypothetical protein Arub01_55130 [Actinomadura rubrobrunea]|uniref:Uncharacterized protein n=1 Tax=Actinomadura rubrobrunea TaxID=115335 RepID=A0A9W6PZK4_9ACTN|nr:hypothetical protein Arub01_55130 [Actinomadura rubrobrunea]
MPEVTARGVRFHAQTSEPSESSEPPKPPHTASPPAAAFAHGLASDRRRPGPSAPSMVGHAGANAFSTAAAAEGGVL